MQLFSAPEWRGGGCLHGNNCHHVGKKKCAIALAILCFNALFAPYTMANDAALPTGGHVVAGVAEIQQVSSQQLDINTASARTAIDWQRFDIGTSNTVTINQPNAQALTLNRVKNGQPTKIFGRLQSNGRVVVANPSGVWFGPNAHVDVAGLVAAAAEIDADDINYDTIDADARAATAGVLAEGSIIVADGGAVTLAGKNVQQRGLIQANQGQASLAAADRFSLNLRADGRLEVQTTQAVANLAQQADGQTPTTAISQQGQINTHQGKIKLAAALATEALNEAINVGAAPQASRAVMVGNIIELQSTEGGLVRVAGTLMADAAAPNAAGGSVKVFGKQIAIEDGAVLTARGGEAGGKGGTILVGGDYLGQKSAAVSAPNAQRTYVAKNAELDASAGAAATADGGRVIVWADDATYFAGAARANAGAAGGNGGFIEISGAISLGFYGAAMAAAPQGQMGRILLDPRDITIAAVGADDANIGTHRFFANPNITTDVVFSAAAVQALTGAVELQASRNIIVNTALNFNNVATTSVNFRAGQAITTTAAIQASGGAALLFNANDPGSSTRLATANINIGGNLGGATTGAITFNNNGGSGYINLTANQTWQANNAAINVNGMQIRADAGNNNRTLTINAGTGTVTLGAVGNGTTVTGNLNITGGTVTTGAIITGATALTRAGGAVTINSTAGLATVGAVTTVGGLVVNTGQAGGAVSITGIGVNVGAVNTSGGNATGAASNAGAGGAVTLSGGTNSLVVGGSITASGGNATTTGTAGNGGNIALSGVLGGLTVTGNITAVGGNTAAVGGVNGSGGNITFNNNIVLNLTGANTTINNAGGVFAGTANGAGGTQTISGTLNYTPGSTRTLTFNAGSGAVNFMGTSITLGNNSTFDLQADAYSLPVAANSLSTGGQVLLRPGSDSTTIGIGTGASGTWQFVQANETSINPSASTVTIGRGSGTGLISIAGTINFTGDNVTIQAGGNGGNINFASNANVSLTGTNQTFTLISGSGASDAITFQSGALLTNNSGATSSVVFSTHNLNVLGGVGAAVGNGNIVFQGPVVGTTIGYGGAAGTLQLTQALINNFPSFVGVFIGSATGTAAVNIAGSLSQSRNLTIRSGGAGGTVNLNPTAAINLTGGTARTLTLLGGSSAANAVIIQNGATINNSTGATGAVVIQANTLTANAAAGALTGNGTLTIQATGNGGTMGIGTGTGQLAITSAVLNQFGGFVSQTFGRGHTNTVNVNGALAFNRTTTISANGNNGSISLGAATAITVTGTNQVLTFNTGTGTTYGGNINSLVVAAGATVTNNTGGNVSLVTNRISAGNAGAFSGTGNLFVQPTADTITTGIGTGTGATTVYGLAELAMFDGFASQTFGRNAGTVSLTLGGAIDFARSTSLRQGGANGLVRFLNTADVTLSGANRTLTINSGSGTTYTGTPAINSITFDPGSRLQNNTGAAGAIVLNANNLVIDPTASISGDGTATLQPLATGTTVGVGTGVGQAQYTDAEIARFSGFNMFNIGRTDSTVMMTISGGINLPLNTTFRSGGGNGAITLTAATVVTGTGTNQQITFTPGNGTGGSITQNILAIASGVTVANNTGSGGAIIINANKLDITAGADLSGDGALIIQPNAVNQSIGLGTGTGGLAINNTVLGALTGFTTQTFGSATGTALLTADGIISLPRHTVLRSQGAGGAVTTAATAAITVSGGNTLDIYTGSNTANTFTHLNGATIAMGTGALGIHANTIALAGANSISGTGALVLESASTTNTMGIGSGAGQLDLSATHLDVFTGFSSQTLGRADGTGAIIANAISYARPTTIRGAASTLDIAGLQTVTNSGDALNIATGTAITFSGAGGITTNGGAITINNNVLLTANTSLASNGGLITFGGTVNADATPRSFTVNAGTGGMVFGGALGAVNPLGATALTAGQNLALPAITTSGAGNALTVNLTAGSLTQTGILTLADGLAVTANTAAGQAVTLTQNNVIDGVITAATHATTGGNIALRNTAATGSQIGTSTTAGNYTLVNTQSNVMQTTTSSITVGGNMTITAPAGTFNQSAGAAFSTNSLALTASNTPTFNSTNTVNNLAAVVSGGSLNYSQNSALAVGTVGALAGIQAQTVSVRTTAGDLTLNEDIVASGSGNAIVVAAAEDFINNAGTNALQPGTGRWLIYSTSPNGSPTFSLGGLTPANKRYNRSFASYGPGSVVETGDVLLFSTQPTLTFTAQNQSRDYGDTNPVLTYGVTGYIDGDTAATAFSGLPSLTTTATQFSPVSGSPYAINITQNTLASALGYAFSFVDAQLTVLPRALTVTVQNSQKDYGDVNPSFSANFAGFAPTEGVGNLSGSLSFSTAATQFSPVSGSPYTVSASGLSSGNYTISYTSGQLTVLPRALTVTADNATRPAGTANPTFTANISGFAPAETIANLSGSLSFNTAANLASPPAIYAVTPFGLSSTNYAITFQAGQLTVTAALTPPVISTSSTPRQDVVPSFIYTRNPSRIAEIAMQLGVGFAVQQGEALGRLPGSLMLPFDDRREWPDTPSAAESDDDQADFYETSF